MTHGRPAQSGLWSALWVNWLPQAPDGWFYGRSMCSGLWYGRDQSGALWQFGLGSA